MANRYQCSDGSYVTEATIRKNYSAALKQKHAGLTVIMCEGCGKERAVDNSHIISRTRCKYDLIVNENHCTDYIWMLWNFFSACRRCHMIWEDWKSGEYLNLLNVAECMLVLKQYDPQGYQMRINYNYQ